jgi:hypothetical protein
VLKLMFGAMIRAAERWRAGQGDRFRTPADGRRQTGSGLGIRGQHRHQGKTLKGPNLNRVSRFALSSTVL